MLSKSLDWAEQKTRVDIRYYLHGGFWNTLGQVFGTGLGLLTTVLLTNLLSETEYGNYKYLISLGTILASLSLTGIGQSILQSAARGISGFYWQTLKINFLYNLGSLIAGSACAAYYYLNGNSFLSIGCILIAALYPLINTFNSTPSYLQGNKRFRETTVTFIIKSVAISTSTIIALLLTGDVLTIFLAFLLSNLFLEIIFFYLYVPRTISHDTDYDQKIFIRYAKHTSVRNFILTISTKLDSILIFQNLGAIELAIYSVANVIPEQIKGSLKNLGTLLVPKYSSYRNIESVRLNILKRTAQTFLLCIPITIIYIYLTPEIMKLLFPNYSVAIFLSQLSALSFPAFALQIPYSFLKAEMDEKKNYIYTVSTSVLQMLVNIAGLITYGLIGVVVARVVGRYLNLLIALMMVYKK